MTTDVGIYEVLLKRSLERGVPADAVAEIFELPVDVVKEMSREVKVERFGTSDQAEYLDNLQWETLERVTTLVRHGSPDQVARISTTVLGKQIAAAGRRPSSALEDQRAELLEAFASIREAPAQALRPGRFVAGNTQVDRRAHRIDDDGE